MRLKLDNNEQKLVLVPLSPISCSSLISFLRFVKENVKLLTLKWNYGCDITRINNWRDSTTSSFFKKFINVDTLASYETQRDLLYFNVLDCDIHFNFHVIISVIKYISFLYTENPIWLNQLISYLDMERQILNLAIK